MSDSPKAAWMPLLGQGFRDEPFTQQKIFVTFHL